MHNHFSFFELVNLVVKLFGMTDVIEDFQY